MYATHAVSEYNTCTIPLIRYHSHAWERCKELRSGIIILPHKIWKFEIKHILLLHVSNRVFLSLMRLTTSSCVARERVRPLTLTISSPGCSMLTELNRLNELYKGIQALKVIFIKVYEENGEWAGNDIHVLCIYECGCGRSIVLQNNVTQISWESESDLRYMIWFYVDQFCIKMNICVVHVSHGTAQWYSLPLTHSEQPWMKAVHWR